MNITSLLHFLQSIYETGLVQQRDRYSDLIKQSRRIPDGDRYIVRAPGRVNLIGEHTDYNGYPVLPMAINRDIVLVGVKRSDRAITVHNSDNRFPSFTFSLDKPLKADRAGAWSNYVKAAINELIKTVPAATGFTAWTDGTIPSAAGLSSSSALVVGAALMFMKINAIQIEDTDLARRLAKAEHFVGTAGGGMDQAISLLGQKNHALKINFFPLRYKAVPMPTDYRVVICHSLLDAPKTEQARREYNRRPVECRLATALIAAELCRAGVSLKHPQRLADIDYDHLPLNKKQYQKIVGQALLPASLDWKTLSRRLSLSKEEIAIKWSIPDEWIDQPPAEGFKCWKRYHHVISEARRVNRACRALAEGDAERFGLLMYGSHQSCRRKFEISTPELNALVDIAWKNGAIGARLTGAGFGGCTVHLVQRSMTEKFMTRLLDDYFAGYLRKNRPDLLEKHPNFHNAVFTTQAMAGAGCLKITD